MSDYARVLKSWGKGAIALRHNLTIVLQDSDFERMRQVRELSCESWL